MEGSTNNYSEKDYLESIKHEIENEYNDIIQYLIAEIENKRNIKIKYFDKGDCIKSSFNTITVPSACRRLLYDFIFCFEDKIKETLKEFPESSSIGNFDNHILKSICLLSVLIMTFHELGHIIQGHYSIKRKTNSQENCWLEFDADIMAVLLFRFLLECRPDFNLLEKNESTILCIFAVSIGFVYCYIVSCREKTDDYPPFDVRIWGSVLIFYESANIDHKEFLVAAAQKMNVRMSLSQDSYIAAEKVIKQISDFFAAVGFTSINADINVFISWMQSEGEKRMKFLNEVHGITD